MKKLYLTGLGMICAGLLHAQSYMGTATYQKTQQVAAIVQLPCPRSIVEDGLNDYMARKGGKGSSIKGFTVYRSIRMTDTDTALSDLYFMTDAKSRQEKDITLLTLMPAGKNQDVMARPSGDTSLMPSARTFLDSLAPVLEAYYIQVQAGNQEDQLQKARKKMNGLISDQADLEKRIRKLEANLDENKKDQAKQAAYLQSNIKSDDDDKKKNQKRLRRLLDEEGSLEKKLRNAKSDLDQNKTDQVRQQSEIEKQQQTLDGIKARRSR